VTANHNFHVGPIDNPDKYRLLQQVGRGGEAELWQAELSVAGSAEPVAIKIRTREAGDFAQSSTRWSEQAELLRFVQHPGVVTVREHFEGAPMHLRGATNGAAQSDGLYLVMNWVDGLALHEWALVNREAPDRLPRILRHLAQVADVLDWLHSGAATPSRREVIHGDLSPGNVIITPPVRPCSSISASYASFHTSPPAQPVLPDTPRQR
jgi:serine/threonine protein kinase